jgi:hypothetical protein
MDMSDFIRREVNIAREAEQGAVILEVLLDHGLDSSAYEGAMHAWRTRHRPRQG